VNWLRKHKNKILITIIVGFLISTFVGFGFYLGDEGGAKNVVAVVNDEKIPYRQFSTLYQRVVNDRRDQGVELKPETLNQIKQEVLQSMIQESTFYQEAKRYGIVVTDGELAQVISSIPVFQKEGKFDARTYSEALHYTMRMTPKEFEETQRRQIAIQRLRLLILQGIKITDKELEQEYNYALNKLTADAKTKFIKEFENNKVALLERVHQEKSSHIMNRWYQQLGSSIKVKVFLDQIERQNQPQ